MKRVLLGLLLLAAAVPATAQETRIAAVVNDEVISVADLMARMRLIFASSNIEDTPQAEERISHQVLRQLVDEKLEMQEAKRLGVTVSDGDVAQQFAFIEQQNNMPKGGLDNYLKGRGIDRSTLVDQLSANVAWGKVLRQNASQATPVSDDEVDAALARLKETAGGPRARVAEIFLGVDSPQQDDEVHRFADRLYDQLRAGAKFAAVAQQFSQSAAAAVGGDIGWVAPSQLSGELAQAVQGLSIDQFSQPIRSTGGYYIVYVIEKQTANGGSNDDVRVALNQVLFALPANASEADRQRAAAHAESVTKNAKSCGEFMQIGHVEAPQGSGDLGKVRVGDLPAELRPTVLALKIAEPSHAVPLRGGIGVLMVCERETAASALPSRDDVGDGLARERLETLARRYLRDLRRAAFVDMRV
jgi:peptidyl-prolyl cis-trans isomerase SurA